LYINFFISEKLKYLPRLFYLCRLLKVHVQLHLLI